MEEDRQTEKEREGEMRRKKTRGEDNTFFFLNEVKQASPLPPSRRDWDPGSATY